MNLSVIISLCIMLGLQTVHGDLVNDLVETILSDPHTKEVIRQAGKRLEKKDSSAPPNPSGYNSGGFRGGDAFATKRNAVYNQIKKLIAKSMKKDTDVTRQKEETQKDIGSKSDLQSKNEAPGGLPWVKKEAPGGLPWKRTLYGRLMDDVNDLFTMSQKTEEIKKKSTDDELVDELAELFKRS